MSPKKTRRGGTYTTGIKKTPSGGYGGQTTGRRGCLSMVLTVVMVALMACDPQSPPLPGRKESAAPPVNVANVKSLCDFVSTFDGSDAARGNVGVKAEMSGVPDSLERKAKDFANAPTDNGKALVLLECTTAGWVH